MRITVQSVMTGFTPTAKGGFSKSQVKYINEDGQERTQTLVSFKNPAVFNTIKDAVQGSSFDVTIAKNGEFTEWSSITAASGSGATPQAGAAVGGAAVPSNVGKVLGSQYETREERIARQRLIVRQSSLSNAIEMLTTGAKSPPELQAVLEMAEQLVDFVFEPEGTLQLNNPGTGIEL